MITVKQIKQSSIIKHLIITCGLSLMTLWFFRDIIFKGHLLYGSDFAAFYLGLKQFLFTEWHKHHSIPYWNPYIFSGIPFWAHFESTIFYPLDFLFWILSPEKAYGYTVFIHLVLAALFMYLFVSSFKLSPFASFLASSVFVFNCFIMATIFDGQMFRVQSYTWIPLIFYFLKKASSESSPTTKINIILAGIFWGFQNLSGSPHDAFYTYLAAFLFLIFFIFNQKTKKIFLIRRMIYLSILFGITGFCISAIQIIPALEFVSQSVRSVVNSYDLVTIGSYPFKGIVTAIMPHFFGSFIYGNYWVGNIPWSIPLYNLYVGILPIILLCFFVGRTAFSDKFFIFSLTLAVISLLLAFGHHTPLYKLAYVIPGFDKTRAPAKIIILWVFSSSLLSGRIMHNIFSDYNIIPSKRIILLLCFVLSMVLLNILFLFDHSIILKIFSPFIPDEAITNKLNLAKEIVLNEFQRLTFLCVLISSSLLVYVRGYFNKKYIIGFLCILHVLDLVYVNIGAVRHYDQKYRSVAKIKLELKNSIGKDNSIFRIGYDDLGLGPNSGLYHEFQTVSGYSPLFLYRYYEYINKYISKDREVKEGWVIFAYGQYKNRILMDLLNVKYDVSSASKSYSIRETYLPRAFFVPYFKIVDRDKILDLIIKADFDPQNAVLFEKADLPVFEHISNTPHEIGRDNWTKITSYQPDEITLEAYSDNSGFLFLSEIYYPGWKAYLDNKPAKIFRGNYLFRVIELPGGYHKVRFTFDPISIKIGTTITLLTLLILVLLAFFHFYRRLFARQRIKNDSRSISLLKKSSNRLM